MIVNLKALINALFPGGYHIITHNGNVLENDFYLYSVPMTLRLIERRNPDGKPALYELEIKEDKLVAEQWQEKNEDKSDLQLQYEEWTQETQLKIKAKLENGTWCGIDFQMACSTVCTLTITETGEKFVVGIIHSGSESKFYWRDDRCPNDEGMDCARKMALFCPSDDTKRIVELRKDGAIIVNGEVVEQVLQS